MQNTFGQGDSKKILRVPNISALDPYSAAIIYERILTIPRSFVFLNPSKLKEEIDDNIYVVDVKKKFAISIFKSSLFLPRTPRRSRNIKASKRIQEYSDYVFSDSVDVGELSEHKMWSSLNSASLSAKSTDLETRLVSLWAAFEAILPEPSKETDRAVRITHFTDLILSCVTYDYIRNKYIECFENCKLNFGKKFLDVVEKWGIGESMEEKFASIMFADDAVKSEMLKCVSRSPLMLNRFWKLEKILEKPANILKRTELHESRVLWQLHRIYRERNDIVHSGRSSVILDGLIENAYLYYRSVIIALENIHRRMGVSKPNRALELISTLHQQKKNKLQKLSNDRSLNQQEKQVGSIQIIFHDYLIEY